MNTYDDWLERPYQQLAAREAEADAAAADEAAAIWDDHADWVDVITQELASSRWDVLRHALYDLPRAPRHPDREGSLAAIGAALERLVDIAITAESERRAEAK